MGTKAKRLKKARRVRHLIASEFRALEKGTLNVQDALENPSYALRRVKIYDVLRRVPGVGEETIKRILYKELKLWPLDRVGKLSEKQRHDILAALPPRAKPS